MSVGFTAERRELARSVRGFVSRHVPMTAVRRLMEEPRGFDPEVWRQMAEQLSLPGIAVPEIYGGAGCGYAELTVVFEELGRGLVPSPFFSTVALALPALLASEDKDALREYAPQLARGSKIATLAWVEDDGGWAGGSRTGARKTNNGWRLDGHKSYVLDALSADVILVTAETPNGRSLFAVAADALGLDRRRSPGFDQTRQLGRIELLDAPARLVGKEGAGGQILSAALDRAAVLLAAEMVGAADACLDMSVGYAKVREQFGRPIGSFQAIKHKCAEVLVELEGARAAAYYAAWAADNNPNELPTVACIAKATAAEAFFRAAAENVQIHGGIGATWEHAAHLFLKRAKTSYILLGDPSYHRLRLADRIGL
ncbi:acyl-CoA dehydrogenase family protein [Bradyrhizobium sp. 169]|uniref:acyl-CoA dehydrogenase family protein n=1 Tax=Bradyrhizobium sp. 169 TaxID=2782640 RepID=UPI001FF6FD48|nr:acyl-CoA dehydrogenase family protein [Bradyrhizobium sp. 169]MCK1592091.1 acyl-CoA/acyl-ACP dehydrogenase [Bradyrhizobium sp. 169]